MSGGALSTCMCKHPVSLCVHAQLCSPVCKNACMHVCAGKVWVKVEGLSAMWENDRVLLEGLFLNHHTLLSVWKLFPEMAAANLSRC